VWQGIEQKVNGAVAPFEHAVRNLKAGPSGAATVAGDYLAANWMLGNPFGQAFLFGQFLWQQGDYAWTVATAHDPVERASAATKLTIDVGLYAASIALARGAGVSGVSRPTDTSAATLRLFEPDLAAGVEGALKAAPKPVPEVAPLPEGSFSIVDWTGYPSSVPRPTGPFRLVGGVEYDAARAAANQANLAIRAAYPELRGSGLHIHEVHPVKLGGDPVSPTNKVLLPAAEHTGPDGIHPLFWRPLQDSLERRK
jgi:hypothetical protein